MQSRPGFPSPPGASGDKDLPMWSHELSEQSEILEKLAGNLAAMQVQVCSELLQVQRMVTDTSHKIDLILQMPNFCGSDISTDNVNLESTSLPQSAFKRMGNLSKTVSFRPNIEDEEPEEHQGPYKLQRSDTLGSVSTHSGNSSARDMERLRQLVQRYRQKSTRRPWAMDIWQFLEERRSSKAAYYYSNFVPALVILSVAMSYAQTIEDWALPTVISETFQISFESFFCAEFILRFVVCPNRITFWMNLFNVIDFVSFLPLVLRLVLWLINGHSDDEILEKVFLLVPLVRLLKILRRFHKFHLLVEAFKNAFEALPVLLYTLLLLALGFTCLIYFLESRDLFPSLSHALWFVLTTMTTVGYGDVVPETGAGHLVTTLLMILSVLYMAIPIGIVGQSFSQVWGDRDMLLLTAAVRERFSSACFSKELIRDIFRLFAKDENNEFEDDCLQLGLPHFRKLMNVLHVTSISEDRIVKLFKMLDEDGGGSISCEEFFHTLFPLQEVQQLEHDKQSESQKEP